MFLLYTIINKLNDKIKIKKKRQEHKSDEMEGIIMLPQSIRDKSGNWETRLEVSPSLKVKVWEKRDQKVNGPMEFGW